jgi:hypothetical protein
MDGPWLATELDQSCRVKRIDRLLDFARADTPVHLETLGTRHSARTVMAVCTESHGRLADQPQLDDGDRLGYLATSAGLSVLVPGFIVRCSWAFTISSWIRSRLSLG